MMELPATPLTTRDLEERGLSSQRISELVAAGELVRPFRGVCLRADLPMTRELRAEALAQVMPAHAVACDHTAAWLLGVDCEPAAALDGPLGLDFVSTRGHRGSDRSGVFGGKRALVNEDIVMVGTVRVTSPARTACDLACRRGRRQALAVLDAFARAYGLTQADYRRLLPRYRGRRGVVQLRELIEYVDARAESLRESWVRLDIIDEGLLVPQPQFWVTLPELGRVRLDLAYPGRKVAVEYDGEEVHDEDAAPADEERRSRLRQAGWIIIVVRKEDLFGERREAWLRELRRALAERGPKRPRRYARGPAVDRPVTRRRR